MARVDGSRRTHYEVTVGLRLLTLIADLSPVKSQRPGSSAFPLAHRENRDAVPYCTLDGLGKIIRRPAPDKFECVGWSRSTNYAGGTIPATRLELDQSGMPRLASVQNGTVFASLLAYVELGGGDLRNPQTNVYGAPRLPGVVPCQTWLRMI
jgi:hypothetical protein